MLSSKKRKSLQATLARLRASRVNGVPGVIVIRGKRPGKVLGITACTHGNEPSGLAVIDYLLNEFNLAEKLKKGTVYLVVNNLKAAEGYLTKSIDGRKNNYRFVDVNMNRLPENPRSWIKDTRYEIRRAKALLPIWRKFDIGFDIHSTSQDSPPFLVGGRIPHTLVRNFPMRRMLTNIDVVQINFPAFRFYGNRNKSTTIEIEAGGHENPASLKRAQRCAVFLLQELGMIIPILRNVKKPIVRTEYRVCDSVVFPNPSYRLVRRFKHAERIRKGQVLAIGNSTPLVAPQDGHAFLCPKRFKKFSSTTEEALFLTEPVRRVTH